MSYETFLVIQILSMCFLSFLMGWMVGANKGARDANKTWEEAFKQK